MGKPHFLLAWGSGSEAAEIRKARATVSPTLWSLLNLIAAAVVYCYLITGGWLTNQYHLNDANIVNLVLAVFEPLAVLGVIAYWVGQNSFLYRLLFILALIQIVIGVGFLAFILLFMLTWHPKMM